MTKEAITANGTKAAGPYSPALRVNDTVYLSGQLPLDSTTGKIVEGGIEAQVTQCFHNIEGLLTAAGLDFTHAVKCTVFLTDMADFAAMNRIYAERFTAPLPVRTAIGVVALPLGAKVEIEMVAVSA